MCIGAERFDDRKSATLVQPHAAAGARFRRCRSLPARATIWRPILWFDQKYFLPDNILTKVDHISMAHAIEVRPPFLDHRIVEFAASLPASLKIQGSRQKVILRNLMRGKLPPAILSAEENRFRHSHARLVPRTAAAVAARRRRGIRVGRTWRILSHSTRSKLMCSAHLDRRANLGYHLWGLMILFFWMKKWGIQTRAPAGTATPDDGKRLHLYLIVLLVAAAVYAGCMISPPSLMDDVDAVQAQIARNMLTSGDWVTARLDGIAYLEKAPLIYWLIARSRSRSSARTTGPRAFPWCWPHSRWPG